VHQVKIAIEYADQVDDCVRAFDRSSDRVRPLQVGGDRRKLSD